MNFLIQQAIAVKFRGSFVITGAQRTQTFTAKSHIIKTSRVRMTGHFTVPVCAIISNGVVVINDPTVTSKKLQLVSAKAKIQ
jgi:hypothetical protein